MIRQLEWHLDNEDKSNENVNFICFFYILPYNLFIFSSVCILKAFDYNGVVVFHKFHKLFLNTSQWFRESQTEPNT